jgi:predicted nuclease of predicted toxin-antitoxin system
VLVAELLRVRGFTVQTTQEAGRKNTSDEEQLAYAVIQQRALLTHNRDDFARLTQTYFASGHTHTTA